MADVLPLSLMVGIAGGACDLHHISPTSGRMVIKGLIARQSEATAGLACKQQMLVGLDMLKMAFHNNVLDDGALPLVCLHPWGACREERSFSTETSMYAQQLCAQQQPVRPTSILGMVAAALGLQLRCIDLRHRGQPTARHGNLRASTRRIESRPLLCFPCRALLRKGHPCIRV